MSIDTLMTMPAVVTPRVISKDGDDDVLTDGTPFDTVCYVWQNSHRRESTENTGPENLEEDTYSAAFPADVAIAANSKVTVAGFDYEVDAPPWQAFNPRSHAVSHLEVTLRRTA